MKRPRNSTTPAHGRSIRNCLASPVDLPRILVLDGGRITAEGTHVQLLRISPQYRRLFASEPE